MRVSQDLNIATHMKHNQIRSHLSAWTYYLKLYFISLKNHKGSTIVSIVNFSKNQFYYMKNFNAQNLMQIKSLFEGLKCSNLYSG
jgi:hypothetical protein